MRPDGDQDPRHDQTADLEGALIAEFLQKRGLTMLTLRTLPEAEQRKIMRDASLHASMRLTEVEARSRYVDDLHQK